LTITFLDKNEFFSDKPPQ